MVPFGPGRERIVGQRTVVVARLLGDFGADPWWPHESLVHGIQFDLSENESGILSEKRVNLPHVPVEGDNRPALFDDRPVAQRQHGFGIENRYLVLQLQALQSGAARL